MLRKDELVREHYRREAHSLHGFEQSIMKDEIVRDREVELVQSFIQSFTKARVLDLGCGNGYALNIVANAHPGISFFGLDSTPELVSIARGIKLPNCEIGEGDARKIPFRDNSFDVIYTQRCLINILDWEEQKMALQEIHRTLKPGGYYLMIECFTNGWANYNRARKKYGLSEIKIAYHNEYIEKDLFMTAIDGMFSIVQPDQSNFLSSHYFISRVLHALVTKGNFVRNSKFVKFFSFLPPQGNYSPIQAYILQKIDGVKLHIGCGERYIPGFTHIDGRPLPHIDYCTSADNLHMFEDNSVSLIYSACLLEHLKRDQVATTLREWYRVLHPGGTVRVSVPDFETIAKVYLTTKDLKQLLGLLIGRQDYPENTHFTVYDFSYLAEVLTDARFKNVRRYDWRQTIHKDHDDFSQAYLPHMDKEHGTLMSLNVEADK